MRIVSARAIPVEIRLTEPFAIASETVDRVDNVFFRLETDNGIIGWSCGAPDTVTSDTAEQSMHIFNSVIKGMLEGSDPTRIHLLNELIDGKVHGNTSTKAGVNMALYDILGKSAGMPLYRLLGGYRDRIETSVTVGINPTDVMVQKSREWVSKGFNCLKLKCGINPDEDIDTVLAVRAAVGPDVKIRLDANEGYSIDDSIRIVHILEEQGADMEFLEQPTKAAYLYALKEVTGKCNVPIVADETALTMRDSLKLIRMEVADVVNIKLMKTGGITNAMKVNTFAEIAAIPVMVGCMNESMGAMAGGVHFACAFANVKYADLDSTLDIAKDYVKGGARFENGFVIPSEEPGLGIEVDVE
ncbi:MAG: dipeptide epimerase [Candidatus Thermoplasmatota archaeon]|nr:dipeptide epimerase [Euryarchaeota archaeon]MBU4032007.1 dipeptide epimerase [Candidatus Thermoplasmatota archaeon]MBU4070777.1 dipeptide epimerase [Candidatus Thermoplasmatota archaeon]MBU4144367.1 dipeptide epimerase [Candidatus Thermoplasmatota archaeon]MBU4592765.1 dipeptide epimerase [Candidatus Thermoplasmatota archaeon]